MNLLLDTNILVYQIRNADFRQQIQERYPSEQYNAFISTVVVGELKAIANIRQWGIQKQNQIAALLESIAIVPINNTAIHERYATIQAYSQGKLPQNPLHTTSRNMGKNDLWIAATASVLNIPLITTDKDFQHLHQKYLQLHLLQP